MSINESFLDKEYSIMIEIEDSSSLTQRELSDKLGVSVSTVNVLINKMIKEGLIKIRQISKRQVLYMLTPQGIFEKTRKTAQYIGIHYKAFYEMKLKMKSVLNRLVQKYDVVFLLIPQNEMGEIINITVSELKECNELCNVTIVNDVNNIPVNKEKLILLLHATLDEELNLPDNLNSIESINLIRLL